MKRIEITGISNISRLADYIDSNMIDIMYIDWYADGMITVLLEDEINLDNPNDKEWLLRLINEALSKCDEHNAKIIFTDEKRIGHQLD